MSELELGIVEPQKIDVRQSMVAAHNHYLSYPPPGGRPMDVLLRGKQTLGGLARCLWPACHETLRDAMAQMEFKARERWLWALYHWQIGETYPDRWMFWREPPRTKVCLEIEPMRYRAPIEHKAGIWYSDGTAADSEEGRRRARANIAEIRRRLGWQRAAGAFWRGKLEAEAAAIRLDLRENMSDEDEIYARKTARLNEITTMLNAAQADVRQWDWEHGRELGQTDVPF